MSKYHTVVAILEAKQGKKKESESALMKVVAPSRSEETNIEYRLHKNIENPQQFILYENWVNKEMHQKQFEKPYIKELANGLSDLLESPYQTYSAEEISTEQIK